MVRSRTKSSSVTTKPCAGRPKRSALLPSTAEPGATVRLRLALLDGAGNYGVDASGEAALAVVPGEGLVVPDSIALTGEALTAERAKRNAEDAAYENAMEAVQCRIQARFADKERMQMRRLLDATQELADAQKRYVQQTLSILRYRLIT